MDRKAQKRASHRALSLKNQHARFVTEYIRRKFPVIYTEADSFYKKVKESNPDKHDLTKTHQFLIQTTEYADYRDFYCRKKKLKVAKQTVTTTTTTTTLHDNMQLNVELLAPEVVKTTINSKTTASSSSESLLPIPEDVYQDLLNHLRADPDLERILEGMILPTHQGEQEDEMTLDPELQKIFQDLEQTPLEKELS